MNITSKKIITNINDCLEKFKREIFVIYLFPLISSLIYYIYILIKVNQKSSTLIFDVTSTRFISFIITVLGIYGFSCFQNKPCFTKSITIFCSIICWFLNFPITKSYINSMNQKNPNWNLLIFFQILYSILIIVLLFILRSLSKNQYSNRFVDSINQILYKEKIALVLLFIGVLALLCIISNSSSAFQITLLFLEVIIGIVFTCINKNLFSPKTVDFTELKLKTKVIDNDNYKVFFCFVNNTININDCYKILISNIEIEFVDIYKTKDFFVEERNIIKNKINNNSLVFEFYKNLKKQDYNDFINKIYHPYICPKIKISFDYKVIHEKSEKNIFYKLNNGYRRTQECEFEYSQTSDKYIKLQ